MAVTFGESKTKTMYTVTYEQRHVRTGKLVQRTSDFVEDLTWFRNQIEKRGGKILNEGPPRQVEYSDVSF